MEYGLFRGIFYFQSIFFLVYSAIQLAGAWMRVEKEQKKVLKGWKKSLGTAAAVLMLLGCMAFVIYMVTVKSEWSWVFMASIVILAAAIFVFGVVVETCFGKIADSEILIPAGAGLLIFVLATTLLLDIHTCPEAERLLLKSGYEEIVYRDHVRSYLLPYMMDGKEQPSLSERQEGADLYLFTARRDGEDYVVAVSPFGNKIAASAPASERENYRWPWQEDR